jgi:hypothetical protein
METTWMMRVGFSAGSQNDVNCKQCTWIAFRRSECSSIRRGSWAKSDHDVGHCRLPVRAGGAAVCFAALGAAGSSVTPTPSWLLEVVLLLLPPASMIRPDGETRSLPVEQP